VSTTEHESIGAWEGPPVRRGIAMSTYSIRELATFIKARLRRVWSVVDRASTLDEAIAKAKMFSSVNTGREVAVFQGRRKVWPTTDLKQRYA